MIPAYLWFIARDKRNHKLRDRGGGILFIDARDMGVMLDRRHRELTEDDIKKISDTYHAFRGEGGIYEDIAGFCKAASIEEIRKHYHILTPGRYVGTVEDEDDGEIFEEKMKQLVSDLKGQIEEENRLNEEIRKQLKNVRFEI